jgi:hypothetical protein
MRSGGFSIGRLMKVVALVALNLTLVRAVPPEMRFAGHWFLLGVLDFLILWKGILRRPLRAFHYTFLIVFVVGFIVLSNQVAMNRLHLIGPIAGWYRHVTGQSSTRPALTDFDEFWAAGALALAVAWAAGLLASRLGRGRGWDVAAFLRGALVGFGLFGLIATVHHAAAGPSEPTTPTVAVSLGLLGVSVVVGGLVGLRRLKSS